MFETAMLARLVRASLYGTTAAVALPGSASDAATPREVADVRSRFVPSAASAPPALVLTREELLRTGLTSLGDILQELTVSGAALNTQFNSGGNGETHVELRHLGADRTLVLVDGRRWTTSLDGVVDVDAIPLAIVDRVEVLPGGASALYGSDAVAGVVNVVTRRAVGGADASAYLGENEEGDGRIEKYDLAVGSSTERASVSLVAAHTKQEPILAGDRGISAVPLFGFSGNNVNVGASSTTPFGRFGFGASGSVLPNGSPGTLTLIPGRPGTAAGDFRPINLAQDGYNVAPDNYLLTPQERTAVYAQGRYHIADDITFETSIVYNERRSGQQLAPAPFVFGTAGSGLNRFTIPANALYNPFGVPVTRAQFRNQVRLRAFGQDADTFRFSGGLEGAFDLADRHFSWDVGYIYADSELRNLSEGQFDINRLAQGLGPSFRDAGGIARCGTPTAVIAGCVPLNIFGGPDGFTREMADFAGVTGQESLYRKTYDYTASLAGELFDLPAGPLAFAIGYEHRREAGFDQPDALAATGATTGAVRVPTRGRFSVDEVHAELAIPVLRDVAFARALDVSIAARRSDYSNFGSTTSPALGFRWQPSRSVSLHGRYTEDFRAPSISELFGGASDSFPILADVCSAAQLAQLGRPDVLARCRNGIGGVLPVPPGYQQPSVQVRATVGGNPDLEPETGRSSALGLRYSPAWADGLQVHLGWHEVVVEDAIRASSAQFVMNDCYVGGRLRSCALITRSPSGDIVDLFHGAQNLPQVVESEGYDLLVDYRFETPVGSFKIDWQSTYLSYFAETWLTAEAGEPGSPRNRAGAYFDRGNVYHRLKSNIAANWRFGDWSANVTARYLSPLDEQCGLPVVLGAPGLCSDPDFDDPQFGGLPANELDETWYFDTQASWDSPWNARITAGVRNLLDADPPVSYATFAGNFDPSYEVPGRFWYLRYRQSF